MKHEEKDIRAGTGTADGYQLGWVQGDQPPSKYGDYRTHPRDIVR